MSNQLGEAATSSSETVLAIVEYMVFFEEPYEFISNNSFKYLDKMGRNRDGAVVFIFCSFTFLMNWTDLFCPEG